MVQSAEPAPSVDSRRGGRTLFQWAAKRSVLVDPEMSPVLVVVGPVLVEQALKVLLVEDDTWSSSSRRTELPEPWQNGVAERLVGSAAVEDPSSASSATRYARRPGSRASAALRGSE